MASEGANSESGECVTASVPLLGGGSLQFSIPKQMIPKIVDNFFTVTTDFPGFGEQENLGTRARSVFLIVQTRPKSSTLALDVVNGSKANLRELPMQGGYRVFIEPMRSTGVVKTYFLFKDVHGNLVVVTDPGSWSRSYSWEHSYPEGYEIRAEIDKRYGDDFRSIDERIENLVNSMMQR